MFSLVHKRFGKWVVKFLWYSWGYCENRKNQSLHLFKRVGSKILILLALKISKYQQTHLQPLKASTIANIDKHFLRVYASLTSGWTIYNIILKLIFAGWIWAKCCDVWDFHHHKWLPRSRCSCHAHIWQWRCQKKAYKCLPPFLQRRVTIIHNPVTFNSSLCFSLLVDISKISMTEIWLNLLALFK